MYYTCKISIRNKAMINHENKTLLQGIGKCLKRTQECLRLTWECLKKDICECPYTYFKTIFFFFLLIAIWLGFEEKWLSLFDNYIGGWLHLPGHWSIKLVIGFGLLGLSLPFYQWYKKCYQITPTIWKLLIFCLVVLFRYHITPSTQYDPQIFLGSLTYFNLIFIVLLLFLSLLLVNRIRIQAKKHANKLENKTTSLWQIDEPIKEYEEDVYYWKEDIERFIEEMDALSLSECAFKIGIIAPWGAGKSSYLNLLKKELKTKDYIVIDFNPRNAKECLSIQELFFQTLSEQLKQYHSGLSSLFQKYMLALQLISPDGWLSRSLSAFRELERKEIQKELNATIKDLPFRVVIVIEDLDRLVREEILEIFKLLDTSASFPNTIYITAYDKNYLRNLFHNENSDSYKDTIIFSDKFFDLEYPMPLIAHNKLINLLEKLLIKRNIPQNKLNSYDSVIQRYEKIFSKYIVTIRDVKRYANLVVTDYTLISREIDFRDFMLMSLLKYKSPEMHRSIYEDTHEKFLEKDTVSYKKNKFYLGEFCDIMDIVFSDKVSKNHGAISEIYYFNQYFKKCLPENISQKIKTCIGYIKEMNGENKVIEIIKKENDPIFIDELIDYFETRELTLLFQGRTSELWRHLEVLLYLYSKYPTYKLAYRFHTIFFGSIGGKNIQIKIIENFSISLDSLKDSIIKIFPKKSNYYLIIKELIYKSINPNLELEDFKDPLIDRKHLLKMNKIHLKKELRHPNASYLNILSRLSGCTYAPKANDPQILLDKKSYESVKRDITIHPKKYIEDFIEVSDSDSEDSLRTISKSLWKYILENKNERDKFILLENFSQKEIYSNFKEPIEWIKKLRLLEQEIENLTFSDVKSLEEIRKTIKTNKFKKKSSFEEILLHKINQKLK